MQYRGTTRQYMSEDHTVIEMKYCIECTCPTLDRWILFADKHGPLQYDTMEQRDEKIRQLESSVKEVQ